MLTGMTTPPESVTTVPRLLIEPDRVIMRGLLGDRAANATLINGTDPGSEDFYDAFEYLEGPGGSDWFLADPKENFDITVKAITVIRRKKDGRLFGYTFRATVCVSDSGGEPEPNGEAHGFIYPYEEAACLRFGDGEPVRITDPEAEDDPFEVWVWLPAEPFTITGYALSS